MLKGANLSTGCSGLAMDPKNPDVLFAGMWDFRRKGWTFRSGGDGPDAPSGSGLFRSADGGKTWTRARRGRERGPARRSRGAASRSSIAPSDPKIVYALVESKDSALYRSADGGETWEARDKSQMMVWRPFYFARLVVDPTNPDRLFKPGPAASSSARTAARASPTRAAARTATGTTSGSIPTTRSTSSAATTAASGSRYDGGNRWWKANNLPVSQFYHVSVDDKDPYQVYGGLQDNSSWVGDSAYPGGITNARWENLYGGDGFWTVVDPTDPDAVYAEAQGGYIGARRPQARARARDIQPKAGYKEKLRFNWNTPIHAQPDAEGHDLHRRAVPVPLARPRRHLGAHLAGPDDQRSREAEAGAVGRRHRRQLVGRDAHDDLLDQRVAEGRAR